MPGSLFDGQCSEGKTLIRPLEIEELSAVSGGMNMTGQPESPNVQDMRNWQGRINPGSGQPYDPDNPRFRN